MGLNAEQRRRRRLSEVDGADRGGGGVVVSGGRLPDNAKAVIDDSCCGRARNIEPISADKHRRRGRLCVLT